MREVIKDRGRLEHMLAAIDNVEEFTRDITLDAFVKSKVLKSQIASLLDE